MLNYRNFNPNYTTNHFVHPQRVDKDDLVQFVRWPQRRVFCSVLIDFIIVRVQFHSFTRFNVWENRRQKSIFLPLSHHRFLIGKLRMKRHGKWENYTSGFLWFFIIFLLSLFLEFISAFPAKDKKTESAQIFHLRSLSWEPLRVIFISQI